MRLSYSFRRGFTLIELLVVIAIIGILSAVVLASLNSARAKARDARRVSDLKQIQLANEMYFDENGSYAANLAALSPRYLPSTPADPTPTQSYAYATNVTVGSQTKGYGVAARLEQDSNTAASDGNPNVTIGSLNCSSALVYCVFP